MSMELSLKPCMSRKITPLPRPWGEFPNRVPNSWRKLGWTFLSSALDLPRQCAHERFSVHDGFNMSPNVNFAHSLQMRVSGGEQDDSRHVSRSRKHSTLIARHLIQPWTWELCAASKWVGNWEEPQWETLCVLLRPDSQQHSEYSLHCILLYCNIVLHEPTLSLSPWVLLAHVWWYFHVFPYISIYIYIYIICIYICPFWSLVGCFHHLPILLSAGFQIQEAGLQAWETQQSLHDPARISPCTNHSM